MVFPLDFVSERIFEQTAKELVSERISELTVLVLVF